LTNPDASARQLAASCLTELARWAEQTPDAPALLGSSEKPLSFAALTARIARVAQVLRDAGVRPGDVVAVAMPDGPGLLTTLLAAMDAATVAPINWQLTEAEFRAQLTLLPACALLVHSATDGYGAAVARALGIPVLELEKPDSAALFELSQARRRVPEQCALILQTSATTGEPKLVPFTHTNLRAICVAAQRGLEFHSKDRYLSIMPLHHILGFSSALGQLMAGGSVACTGFDAERFVAWIEELSPTWYVAGPALHQAILEIAKENPAPFHRSALRFVRCGSGAGSPALLNNLERVLQVTVINGYGLTEAGPVTNTPPRLPRKPGSVGMAIGPEIGIMNDSGTLLPPGSEGEVVLRGAEIMNGYLGAAELNREIFRAGWFHTGDLGRLDSDGDLFITGRIKEIINRGGETISPLEIDFALSEHPAIAKAASFAVQHPTLGEDIVAAVVLRPGVRATASQLRSFLAERLSRSKVPGRIWFVETIPVSASGKPLRSSLSRDFQSIGRRARSEGTLAPDESDASLRRQIAEIWSRVLDSDLPGDEDNFFAMGGDSLSASRLFALLEAEFQLEDSPLDPAPFFDSPTLSQLVAVVAGRQNGLSGPAEMRFENVSALCLQASGDGPPLFFFPGEDLEAWYLRHLARSLGDGQPFFALRHRLRDPAEFGDIASRFVTLISQIQPNGPIVLAGHCYGGILAFEVAQRLIAMSRTGVAVILVDVATPGYPKTGIATYVRRLPGALEALLGGSGAVSELAGHVRFLRALHKGNQMAMQQSTLPKAAESSLSPGGVVLRTYVPRPFPGLLANALAKGHQASERVLEDSRKGWRDFARGPFREGSISGKHDSIFDAQNAPLLADFIRSTVEDLVSSTRPAVP